MKFWFLLNRFTRALWFLPAVFSVFAVLMLTTAYFSSYLFPQKLNSKDLPITVSAEALHSVLNIVASSMLTVTVFALSTLVYVLFGASQVTSPRAVTLIVGDRTAQTSISIFIGAFLFSIVGIVGISGGIYTTAGRLVLFIATVVVIVAVVWSLIRWIGHISVAGRVAETTQRVETATRTALRRLGPDLRYWCSPAATGHPYAIELTIDQLGFVQHFDRALLQQLAEEKNLTIEVAAPPGAYVDFQTVLARIDGEVDEACRASIRNAFIVGQQRTFEYDPGYGLSVLAEIARRALSPAINDPGTAVDVMTTQTRLLAEWARRDTHQETSSQDPCDRVLMAPVDPSDLLNEAFHSFSLDAAASLDVTLSMLRGLNTLAETAPREFRAPAERLACEICARSEDAMSFAPDILAVKAAASQLRR